MPGTRRPSGDVQGGVPLDPRDMAKAGLLEAQSPVVKVRTHRKRRLEPMLVSCPGMNRETGQPLGCETSLNESGQGDVWAAYVTLDTYDEDVPRDRLRGASPMATECP
jgi:hypothetical protein